MIIVGADFPFYLKNTLFLLKMKKSGWISLETCGCWAPKAPTLTRGLIKLAIITCWTLPWYHFLSSQKSNISIIVTAQNPFEKSRYGVTIRRQMQYLVSAKLCKLKLCKAESPVLRKMICFIYFRWPFSLRSTNRLFWHWGINFKNEK